MREPDPGTWLDPESDGIAERGWFPIYLIHLLVLIPTFTAMFFTSGLVVVFVTLIDSGHADWTAANWFAYGVPIAFILWATSGILLPLGAGRWLADDIGARRPTTLELEAYEDAIDTLAVGDNNARRPKHLYVLDENDLNACVVADTIIVNRELLNTGYSEAIIAHELGHLNSMDARVTVAVNRLGAFARTSGALHQGYREAAAEQGRGSCLVGFVILVIRACSGGLANNMMAPAWASWWRLREYAADDYAARLGQAEHLANLLETHGLLYDTPIRRVWATTHSPPTRRATHRPTTPPRTGMTPTALSTLSRVRYPVAPPPVRLKPATNDPLRTTSRAGLTRPDASATQHPSSGPGDRNFQEHQMPDANNDTRRIELKPATIEAIAQRVAELLTPRSPAEPASALIDAGELARRTGVSRTWIYQHAAQLGAIRLGDGPRARLRFGADTVERLSTAIVAETVPLVSDGPRRPSSAAPVDLLPIRGRAMPVSRRSLLRRRSH